GTAKRIRGSKHRAKPQELWWQFPRAQTPEQTAQRSTNKAGQNFRSCRIAAGKACRDWATVRPIDPFASAAAAFPEISRRRELPSSTWDRARNESDSLLFFQANAGACVPPSQSLRRWNRRDTRQRRVPDQFETGQTLRK